MITRNASFMLMAGFAAAQLLSAAPTLAQAAAPVKFASLKGDATKGATDFAVCKACHGVDGKNKIGPHLNGVVGRTSGTVEGFRYSDANKKGHLVWTPEVLFNYLENPRKMVPGTYMTYAGMADPQKRANIIAYLGTQK